MADETIDVTTETPLPTDASVSAGSAVTDPAPSTTIAANDQASSDVATDGVPEPITNTPAPAEPAVCEPVDHDAVVAAHGGIEALLVKVHDDVAFLRSIFGWPENK